MYKYLSPIAISANIYMYILAEVDQGLNNGEGGANLKNEQGKPK